MTGHLPADDLAALALNDPDLEGRDSAAARAHLADCAECRDEFADLALLGRRGRAVGDLVRSGLTAPPAGLWARVAAEAGVDTPSLVPPLPDRREPTTYAAAPAAAQASPVVPAGVGAPRTPAGSQAANAPARPVRQMLPRLALAAAVGVVVGVGATLVGTEVLDDDPATVTGPPVTSPDDTVLARTRLSPLSPQDARGAAELHTSGRVRQLDVDLSAVDTGVGFVQVWLFDPETLGMVSVGVLDGDSGSFVIPPGLDLQTYRGVDISLEPYDGDPAHAAGSLARGLLRSA